MPICTWPVQILLPTVVSGLLSYGRTEPSGSLRFETSHPSNVWNFVPHPRAKGEYMPNYTLRETVIDGQVVLVKVCPPSRRKAASRITKAKYQRLCKGAQHVAEENGQIQRDI